MYSRLYVFSLSARLYGDGLGLNAAEDISLSEQLKTIDILIEKRDEQAKVEKLLKEELGKKVELLAENFDLKIDVDWSYVNSKTLDKRLNELGEMLDAGTWPRSDKVYNSLYFSILSTNLYGDSLGLNAKDDITLSEQLKRIDILIEKRDEQAKIEKLLKKELSKKAEKLAEDFDLEIKISWYRVNLKVFEKRLNELEEMLEADAWPTNDEVLKAIHFSFFPTSIVVGEVRLNIRDDIQLEEQLKVVNLLIEKKDVLSEKAETLAKNFDLTIAINWKIVDIKVLEKRLNELGAMLEADTWPTNDKRFKSLFFSVLSEYNAYLYKVGLNAIDDISLSNQLKQMKQNK